MKIIEHRVNTSGEFRNVPTEHGVEIDLRSTKDGIYLAHDPFVDGESFEMWLAEWRGQLLVLNVKEEGIEDEIIELLTKFRIPNYFFLDQSFPYMQKLIASGNRNTASRMSDLESVNTVLQSKSNWVWIDCFSGDWSFLQEELPKLNDSGVLTCLVSPELHRLNNRDQETILLKAILSDIGIRIDAVCTKFPEDWLNFDI